MKKITFLVAVLMILALMLAACDGAATPTEAPEVEPTEAPAEKRTLVVAAFGGTWETAMMEAVVEPFQEKYPNVEVVITLPGNSAAIVGQLRAEKGNPTIDVALFGGGLDVAAANEGLIEKLDYSNIPNINDIYDVALPGVDGYGPSVAFAGVKLAYNTEQVTTVPTSWDLLWDPTLAGKVGIYNADNNGGLMLLYLMSVVNGGDVDNMDPGFEKMVALNDNDAIFTSSSPEMQEMLVQETIHAAVIFDGRAIALIKDGFPIALVCPAEGCFVTHTYANVVAGSPNKDLGEAFINQYISVESSKRFAELAGYGPVNKKVVLDDYDANLVIYGEDQIAKLIALPWDDINRNRDEWVDRWNREVLAQE